MSSSLRILNIFHAFDGLRRANISFVTKSVLMMTIHFYIDAQLLIDHVNNILLANLLLHISFLLSVRNIGELDSQEMLTIKIYDSGKKCIYWGTMTLTVMKMAITHTQTESYNQRNLQKTCTSAWEKWT